MATWLFDGRKKIQNLGFFFFFFKFAVSVAKGISRFSCSKCHVARLCFVIVFLLFKNLAIESLFNQENLEKLAKEISSLVNNMSEMPYILIFC